MKNSSNTIRQTPVLRIRWGALVLIIGFLSPLLIPLVVTSDWPEWIKVTLSGGLAFGIPELFMILAVAIMGREGFNYLKKYLRFIIRIYGPPDRVSKSRYTFGLIFFCLPLIFGLIAPYFLFDIKFYFENVFFITLVSDMMLLVSLFVLGGEFWDKLRGLFIWRASINFPNKIK